jgi:hypothetical protein
MTPPELVAARGPAGGYIHAASAFDDELRRLLLLEARYDTQTFRRLSACGPLSGAQCLDVGAGAGSVARWLRPPALAMYYGGRTGRFTMATARPGDLAVPVGSDFRLEKAPGRS